MSEYLTACLNEYVPVINAYLKELRFTDQIGARLAAPLDNAMHYSVDAGGKRLRPVLTIMAYRLLADDWQRALPVAAAYELIHTYSLIHDDLPAMDDDDLRRGRPTNHRVYGEAMAILAGDALLTEAFRLLAEEVDADSGTVVKLISGLSRAAGRDGMVGGQAIDILSQGGNDQANANIDQQSELLETLHRRKTGAMITGSLLAGVDLAQGDPFLRSRLTEFGSIVGLAFQVADDILDEVGEEESLGKDIGSDRELGKLTFVSLFGLEEARLRLADLHRQALLLLEPLGEKADSLKALADYIVERDR
ncbi:MAG: polyprenyl synthetase family protein [Deltaproteobacteria bacterium]|nr:polyprenyl synthetase family protein [Candidatus Tharpella aukensis]